METKATTTAWVENENAARDVLPLDLPSGAVVFADDARSLRRAVNCLARDAVIGLDTEWRPDSSRASKKNKTSLLQLAGRRSAALLDVPALCATCAPDAIDEALRAILVTGCRFPKLTNEIYALMMKQLTGNQRFPVANVDGEVIDARGGVVDSAVDNIRCCSCADGVARGWQALYAAAGVLTPSADFVPFVRRFLRDHDYTASTTAAGSARERGDDEQQVRFSLAGSLSCLP